MLATPQLDELFAGAIVAADVLDDLRDRTQKGGKVGFADLLSAVITANGPVAKAFEGHAQFRAELDAAFSDRETAGHVGQQLGYALHAIVKDLRDPAA